MYKALAFKELREIGWIGGIILAATVLVVLDQIGGAVSPWQLLSFGMIPVDPLAPRKIPFLHESLAVDLAWVTVAGGLALGFRQVFGETFRSTWLFLLHRPAPRSRIMLTKLGVGAGLLLATTVLPLVVLAIWAAMPQTHASPFDWRMTNVAFRICFGATAIYLAAFLTGLRDARWYGSRLFPLVFAALAMAWICIVIWWPVTGWLVAFVVDAIYVAAILLTAQMREY